MSFNLHYRATATAPAAVALALLLAAGACKTTEEAEPNGQPAGVVFTDPMVAGAYATGNASVVEASRLALNKSTNDQVRQLAERLITDHTYLIQKTTELADRKDMSLETSALAEEIQRNSRQTVTNLSEYEGLAFDRAYIKDQVTMHRYLLQLLDVTLIPAARDDALEDLMEKTRPILTEHLRLAEQIQAALDP